MILDILTVLQIIGLIISILTLLGVGAFFAEIFKGKAKDAAEKTLLNKKNKKAQQVEEFKAIIKSATKEDFDSLKAEFASMKIDIKEIHEQIAKDEAGTLSCLRNDILTCYYRCNEKGYRNDYDYKNIHDMYEAYFALGGNSFVEDVMKRFDQLPTKEEFNKINGK